MYGIAGTIEAVTDGGNELTEHLARAAAGRPLIAGMGPRTEFTPVAGLGLG